MREVEARVREAAGRLERQAADRVRELEKAELLGELHAIGEVLAERREAIADLEKEEVALRKRLRDLTDGK